jgi:hypothetical protein
METAACPDLNKMLTGLAGGDAASIPMGLAEICKRCFTRVNNDVSSVCLDALKGTARKYTSPVRSRICKQLRAAQESRDPQVLDELLATIEEVQGRKAMHRRELWDDLRSSVQKHCEDPTLTLTAAGAQARDRHRQMGLRPCARLVARPILVKGLAFDHVVVFGAEKFDRIGLYVAMTRARKSLKIVSKAPSIEIRP